MIPKDQKNQIKKEILEKIKVTKDSIESLLEQIKPVSPDNAIGRVTRMDAIQQQGVSEANLLQAQDHLKNLTKALENLDNDDFGVCSSCRQAIPLERILAIPEARMCVPCLEKLQ